MGVDTEGAKDPKEDFRVVHDAVEVFRTRALGHEHYIVGRMAFARFSGCRRQVALDKTGSFGCAFRVGNDVSFGIGRCRNSRFRLETIIFVMVRGIGVLHGQGDIRIRVIGIPVVVFINEGRPLGIAVDANRFAAGLAIFFLIGAADADAVGMVRNDNDKCIIIVLFGVVLRPFDGLIKFDGV